MATKKSTKKTSTKKVNEVGIEFDFVNAYTHPTESKLMAKEGPAPTNRDYVAKSTFSSMEKSCQDCCDCCDSCTGKAREYLGMQEIEDMRYEAEVQEAVQQSVETNDDKVLKPYLSANTMPKKRSLWQRIKDWFRKR